MGLASLDVLGGSAFSQQLLSKSLLSAASKPPAAAARPPSQAASPPAVQDSFDAITYSSKVQRMSLMAQFQEASVQYQETGEDGVALAAHMRQMSFDFFFESREESLAVFSQRTGQVAEGLEGAQRSNYLATSQQVAARFQFSVSISSASLNGFADASEAFQQTEELMGKLLEFTQKLLQESDEFFNDFLSALGGNVADEKQVSFQDLFERLVGEFLGGLNGAAPALGGAGAGQTSQYASVQMEFNFSFSAEITVEQGQVQQSDPIILDLDGDGFELSHYSQGANFDILGKGQAVKTAFVNGGDAFLALDRNGDGVINSGKELFGDQWGASNGYEELRKLDGNQDGVIDSQDAIYADLSLFRDNGNGITEEGELISLADAGIAEISLNYRNVDQATGGGNRLAQVGAYRHSDGSYGNAGDAILNFVA